ncbi:hypothetical protein ABPG74_016426 [Tetrahymena malaccensis]
MGVSISLGQTLSYKHFMIAAGSIGIYFMLKKAKEKIKFHIQKMCYEIESQQCEIKKQGRPKFLILLRHGESEANIDPHVYTHKADNQIELTEKGKKQASKLGDILNKLIDKDSKITMYISPLKRAMQTAHILEQYLNVENKIVDPRLREQEWGNLQKFQLDKTKSLQVLNERKLVSRLFYRFETGESGCDAYNRVSSFWETLFRDMDNPNSQGKNSNNRVFVIVSHGIIQRLLVFRYLRADVEYYDTMPNPSNCETWILKLNSKGKYDFYDKIIMEGIE